MEFNMDKNNNDEDMMEMMKELAKVMADDKMDHVKSFTVNVANNQIYESISVFRLMRVSLLHEPLTLFAKIQLKDNEWSDEDLEIMGKHMTLLQQLCDIINKLEIEKLRNEGA